MKHLLISLIALIGVLPVSAHLNNEYVETSSQRREISIVFIGNSITYGAQHKNPVQTAPPVISSALLEKK